MSRSPWPKTARLRRRGASSPHLARQMHRPRGKTKILLTILDQHLFKSNGVVFQNAQLY